jgi:hypothetical protein
MNLGHRGRMGRWREAFQQTTADAPLGLSNHTPDFRRSKWKSHRNPTSAAIGAGSTAVSG